jgi:pimeloyl-ACP methyl ester carboxylesterase
MNMLYEEKIVTFGENSELTGILTCPLNTQNKKKYCFVLLNPGLIHKIGANRINVQIARKLAETGIPAFRFDFSGIGDSSIRYSGADSIETRTNEIGLAMDAISNSLGIKEFYLKGICSGAEAAFKAAQEDERIRGLMLIDGRYHDWELLDQVLPVAERKNAIRYYKKNLLSIKRWVKLLTGQSLLLNSSNIYALAKHLTRKSFSVFRSNGKNAPQKPVFSIIQWNKLLKREVKTCLIFCEGSIFYDLYKLTIASELEKFRNEEFFEVKILKNVDHTFTPIWSQKLLWEILNNWLIK